MTAAARRLACALLLCRCVGSASASDPVADVRVSAPPRAAGIFWTYDDPAVLADTMRFAVGQRLGGVVCCNLSGDDADGTLIAALHAARQPLPNSAR